MAAGACRWTHTLGIDLGSVNVKAVLCSPDGSPRSAVSLPARGRPLHTLRMALARLSGLEDRDRRLRVGVTGGGSVLLSRGLPLALVNEVVAAATAVHRTRPGARTVLDLGGQFSKWIVLETEGARAGAVIDFATNGLCAAGSGAFMEQQARRLRLSVDELGREAAGATRGATIAGRCSVFAKSDMIHLQQKGTPVDEIAFGLCQTLVRQFLTTVLAGRRIQPPVVIVGGGAASEGLVRAFRDALGLPRDALVVADEPLLAGALGAAACASSAPVTTAGELLAALGTGRQPGVVVGQPARRRGRPGDGPAPPALAPLGDVARPPVSVRDEAPEPRDGIVEAWLGVDVGSVSTNLVLLGPDLEFLHGIYLPTRGRPVEVLDDGLSRLRERFGDRLHVLGVGTTGSGRHLAAGLLGADLVRNEISAQTVSAARFVPEVDTIFEIGGQDSKFVSVREGRLADFEMNKICAAGTGSFLEEQAERLGIDILGEFARHALGARHPVDLGSRCTVFMDTELVHAQERGAGLQDLCAGLAYSVVRNYLEKVVAGRHLGRCIVFQGGTASNAAVVAAFRSILGRPVQVHPYNRLSGALGAALMAAEARGAGAASPSRFLGFRACEGAETRSFECRRCDNRCQVNQVRVAGRAMHFGDSCERFSERDREAEVAGKVFGGLLAAREALLAAHAVHAGDDTRGTAGPAMGLLRASINLEFLPFWTAFLRALGYRPIVAPATSAALLAAHPPGVPAELCLPIKAAAAQARALLEGGEVEQLFVPALQECPRHGDDKGQTCLYNQQLGDMLRGELGGRVVTAQFALDEGRLGLVEPAFALAALLDRSVREVLGALAVARTVQDEFGAARRELGREALAADFDRAAVILGKPYNTHDPYLNLGLARLLGKVGLPAIPWDLLPLEEVRLDERWRTVPWHYNREQLRALEIVRGDERLFPVLVSSYGCGPDAFVGKHLVEMLAGIPRLVLEFDEHRGEAGLLTRLEAFVDEIESYRARRPAVRRCQPTPGPGHRPRGRRFFLPNFAPHAQVYRAALRGAGLEAEVLPAPDSETVRVGEELASGRECHPHAILAGELAQWLRGAELRHDDVFISLSCVAPCLLRQYGDSFRLMCQRLGRQIEIWDASAIDLREIMGTRGVLWLYEGLLAVDLLTTLSSRLRAYATDRAAFARALEDGLGGVVAAVESRQPLPAALGDAAGALWNLPRDGEPGDRPVVGVTGDLYTRIIPLGNAGLFDRLERAGCEVWPSPFFAQSFDLSAAQNLPRNLRRLRPASALGYGLAQVLTAPGRRALIGALPVAAAALAAEPGPERLMELAAPYVGPCTNHLLLVVVAKIADFLTRGATGVINAAGINCMVGTAVASAVPRLRDDFDHAPVVTLLYGGTEGPAQRIRLETFLHQVMERRDRSERIKVPGFAPSARRDRRHSPPSAGS